VIKRIDEYYLEHFKKVTIAWVYEELIIYPNTVEPGYERVVGLETHPNADHVTWLSGKMISEGKSQILVQIVESIPDEWEELDIEIKRERTAEKLLDGPFFDT